MAPRTERATRWGKARLTIGGDEGYAAALKDIAKAPLGLDSYLELMDSAGKSFDAAEGVDFFQAYLDAGPYFVDPGKRLSEFKPIYPNVAY